MQSVAVLRNFTRFNCAEPKSQGCRKFLFPVRRVGNFNVGRDRAPKGGPTRTVREGESTRWTFTSRYQQASPGDVEWWHSHALWHCCINSASIRIRGNLSYPRSRCLPSYVSNVPVNMRTQRHSQTPYCSSPYEALDRAFRGGRNPIHGWTTYRTRSAHVSLGRRF